MCIDGRGGSENVLSVGEDIEERGERKGSRVDERARARRRDVDGRDECG